MVGVAHARAEAAVGAAHDVVPANEVSVAHESLSNQVGGLDEIGVMPDDAGDQLGVLRQLDLLPERPFVEVGGVGGLDRVGGRLDLEDQADDVGEEMSDLWGPW